MPRFSLTRYDVPTGEVVDTWKTLAGLKAEDTTGHIGRLRKLVIGGGGGAAQDIQISVRLLLTDNTTDGTSTPLVPTKIDPNSVDSVMTGGVNYTAEPTALASTYLFEGGFNARGLIIPEWARGEGHVWGPNQTLILQATPGIAEAVLTVFTLEWDE